MRGDVLEACRDSAAALCARAQTCSPVLLAFAFGSWDACVSDVTEECARRYEGPGVGSTIESCALRGAQMACETFRQSAADFARFSGDGFAAHLLRECPVAPGTSPLGASCFAHGDCQSGLCARSTSSKTDYACGVCTPLKREGDQCSESAECLSPLECAGAPKRCKANKVIDDLCDSETRCAGSICFEGRCSRLLAHEGDACDAAKGLVCDLGLGLVCDDGGDTTVHACTAMTIATAGEPCDRLDVKAGARLCAGAGTGRSDCEDALAGDVVPRRCAPLRERAFHQCAGASECTTTTSNARDLLNDPKPAGAPPWSCTNGHCSRACFASSETP